jgi:hypothetical protein
LENKLKHIPIVFNSEWFLSGYFVYVLTIHHKTEGTYYYVGQTGDRKHISARSPFYRLMAHFRPYKSTDNQLVTGLVTNSLIKPTEEKSIRICIEDAIFNKAIEIKADYFIIEEFDKIEHKTRTKLVEEIEQEVIDLFLLRKKKIFNDSNKIGSRKIVSNVKAKNKALEIIDTLGIKK